MISKLPTYALIGSLLLLAASGSFGWWKPDDYTTADAPKVITQEPIHVIEIPPRYTGTNTVVRFFEFEPYPGIVCIEYIASPSPGWSCVQYEEKPSE